MIFGLEQWGGGGNMIPYIVLKDKYLPSEWRARVIGRELTELTAKAGLKPHVDPAHGPIHWKRGWYSDALHAEVRRTTIAAPAASDWHYDGDTTPGSKPDCALVVWTNRTPTELKWEGHTYQPPPFSVVLFRNRGPLHRRPTNAPARRWMFRQRVQVPKGMNLP